MFQLTFLGTSAGVPTKQRNVTGLGVALVNPHSQHRHTPWLLIDCGEGTQQQILHTTLSLTQLRAICITHVHGDHCYGLAGLLASMAMGGRIEPLTLIAPRAIEKLLDTLTITTELYFPYAIEFIALESLQYTDEQGETRFHAVDLTLSASHLVSIEPIALSHRVASHAFKLHQRIDYTILDIQKLTDMGLPPSALWGKLQRGETVVLDDGATLSPTDFVRAESDETTIIVAGDNDSPNLLATHMAGVTLLVHEATYTQATADKIKARMDGFDPKHSSAQQVATFATTANLPNLILTHFSGRFQPFDNPNDVTSNMGHIRQEVEKYYQGNFWLANDFDGFNVTHQQVKKWDNN